MVSRLVFAGLCAIVISCGTSSTAVCAEERESDHDFFENRVRPLLAAKCLNCHSTATGKTSGGLALDTRQGWTEGGDNGTAIVPGQPADSLLIRAISYTDDNLQMPPPDKGGQLSKTEIATLVEWVQRGAFDPRDAEVRLGGMSAADARRWWAFQPLAQVTPPDIATGWARNDIDRFVWQKLQEQGLTPSAGADKRTLIRRAAFDLTGLPPRPEQIQEFLNDNSEDAFAKVIDRLLADQSYGERWGRHWLDVARYADTAGDGADYPVREAGKYRDWVIQAFNADQPFDEFIRDQIAGDIRALETTAEEYARRVTATGFLAIGKRYGYNPSPDYQYLDFADVIDSVGRSILGLSVGCARCHDHKYDPVTAADYYALYGILQSTQWAFPGGEEHKRPTAFPPLVPPEEAARLDQAKAAELARLDGVIAALQAERRTRDKTRHAGGTDLGFEGQKPGGAPVTPWFAAGNNSVITEAQSPFQHIHPAGTRGVRLGSGLQTDGIRYVFDTGLKATPGQQMHFAVDFRTVPHAEHTGSYRFYLGRGVIESLAIEFSVSQTEIALKNGTTWEVVRTLEPGQWYTLQVTLDPAAKTYAGSVGTPNDLTQFAGKGLHPQWDGIANTFICDGFGHVNGPVPVRDVDNIGLQETPFGLPGSGPVPALELTAQDMERIAEIDRELTSQQQARTAEANRVPYEVAYGVTEGKPVNARIQKRGEPDQLGAEVPRGFLEILGHDRVPAESTGSGRKELADWLTRPENPLTARVFVNRVWQWHFGRGLVPTASDFGTRGERPSHPELLDWLAGEFIRSGWSVKHLHRQIMLSATYQQSSDWHAGNAASDPGNKWLWHYARRSLDAESIRDAMLSISGRLDRSIPVVHPFPPVESWAYTIHNPFHAVYDSDRRSVYLMVQRNRRHPFLALFDAADPNQSVAERQPTTTPTQSLFLMNSPFVHDQSRAFAQRLLALDTDTAGRVRQAFELAHGRPASDADVTATEQFLVAYQEKLAARGIAAEARSLDAWAAFCRTLLTSNALLYVD